MAKGKAQELRRRAPRGLGKSEVINFRIKPDTRLLLEEAAQQSGRTLSAEAEHQLWRALSDMGTGPTHAIMGLIGRSIDDLVHMRNLKPGGELNWWNDSYLFRMAGQVVHTAFELLRPPNFAPVSDEDQFEAGGRYQGRTTIELMVRELQLFDATRPFSKDPKKARHQRWLWLLQNDLGQLVDRPIVWGRTAKQARGGKLPKKMREEFVELRQKQALAKKIPPQATITAADRKRFEELIIRMTNYWKRRSKKS